MPQMAPMNWTLLYIMFTIIFLMINYLNYYMYMIKNKKIKIMYYMNNMFEWKW